MIFVFAGLIILILSFVIALISLVRDSAKAEKPVDEPRPAASEVLPKLDENFEQSAQSLTNDALNFGASKPPVATPLPPETNAPSQDEKKPEPFLWEGKKEEEVSPEKVELPWEKRSQDKGIAKLSGEISLRNIKK